MEINIGDKFINKYGDYSIIDIIPEDNKRKYKLYKIKFKYSGYITVVSKESIIRNNIIDFYQPTEYGIGIIGDIDIRNHEIEYRLWKSILQEISQSFSQYTLCDRWKYLSNFIQDISKYHISLDEDSIFRHKSIGEFNFDNCEIISKYDAIDYGREIEGDKCGKFVPLYYYEENNVVYIKIRFIDTGNEISVTYDQYKRRRFSDKFARTVCGIGYIGNGDTSLLRERAIWGRMISRCYNKRDGSYKYYGKIGITVDERWHSYELFLYDLPSLPGYMEWKNSINGEYHLDKDYLQQNIPKSQRIYSKDTCCFIRSDENNDLMLNEQHQASIRRYIGIDYNASGTYSVKISDKRYGTYSNEIAAANAYNYYASMKEINRRNNVSEYMNYNQFNSYRTNQQHPLGLNIMCKIVKDR